MTATPTHTPTARFAVDNRWTPGNSGHLPPPDAPAAYSARWTDRPGEPAGLVPDRSGFAYTTPEARDRLVELLARTQPHLHVGEAVRDGDPHRIDRDELTVVLRRAGGYTYVDAWTSA